MLARLRTSLVFASKTEPLKTEDDRQSPTKRHSHRLSKPPTNGSFSNLLAVAAKESPPSPAENSPVNISNCFDAVNTSLTGERRSRQDAREAVRSHLFGDSSESSPRIGQEEGKTNINTQESQNGSSAQGAQNDEARLSRQSSQNDPPRLSRQGSKNDPTKITRRGSLVGTLKDRLSRSGSLVSQIASSKGSTTHLPNTVNDSRLSRVAESIIGDNESSHEWILSKIENDEWAAKNYVTSPVEENSSHQLVAPIRRRSLLTPGIATRIPSDILRKPPRPDNHITEADREYYFNPAYPETSPLSQLEALDLAEEEWVMPTERIATPIELDYSHLGGLRPGTLHITNGAASPAPSDATPRIIRRRSSPALSHNDDYFSVSEGWRSDDGDTSSQVSFTNHDAFVGTALRLEIRSETLLKALHPGRGGSPLRYGVPDEFTTLDVEHDHFVHNIPQTIHQPSSLRDVVVPSPDRTSAIAEKYMAEIPDSPFSFQRSPSPQLEPTSKATEFDDQLFDDQSFDDQSFDDEGIFTSPAEDIERTRLENAYAVPASYQVHASSEEHVTANRSPSQKALTKADSGYSSNASLHSLRGDRESRSQEVKITVSSVTKLERPPTLIISNSSNETAVPSLPEPESTAHLQPSSAAERSKPKALRPSILVRSKTNPVGHSHAGVHQSTDTLGTLLTTASAPVDEMKRPKKLRKQRPLSQPPPAKSITVQGYREMTQAHIPPIPPEVEARLAERTKKFPELRHTFKSLHHTKSSSTLSDMPFDPVPIRFPSPIDGRNSPPPLPSITSESESTILGDTVDSPKPSFQNASRSRRLPKSARRSSQLRVSEEPDLATTLATIRDFGTVTESLGRGPYDAARSSLPPRLPRGADNRHLSHPHNISSTTPRAKSMTGMDAQEAAELARLKSKTLAERREFSWEEKQKIFNDRGGIPGKIVRPKSLIVNAPPMPSLPSPAQVQECEIRHVSIERTSRHTAFNMKNTTSRIHAPKPTKVVKVPKTLSTASSQELSQKFGLSTEVKPAHTASVESQQSWQPHSEAWKARKKSAREALGLFRRKTSDEDKLPRLQRHQAGASSTEVSLPPSQLDPSASDLSPLEPRVGRYDGGLGYGYEHGAGLGDSAGTRDTSGKAGGSRKSVAWSRGYGVDLSDVPIIAAIRKL